MKTKELLTRLMDCQDQEADAVVFMNGVAIRIDNVIPAQEHGDTNKIILLIS